MLLEPCRKLLRHDLPLEACTGHEQGGEQGPDPRHPGAALVVDLEPAVAQEAAEGLLDLPPARLDREAGLVFPSDQLELDAVPLQRGRGALAGEGEVGPHLAQAARRELRLEPGCRGPGPRPAPRAALAPGPRCRSAAGACGPSSSCARRTRAGRPAARSARSG